MQKIVPLLWFDGNAEEAANFYVSIFKNSRVTDISRYGEAGPGPAGSAMVVEYEIEGQEFMALNGGQTENGSPGPAPGSIALLCQLRNAGRGRYSLGEALRRRQESAVRLAER